MHIWCAFDLILHDELQCEPNFCDRTPWIQAWLQIFFSCLLSPELWCPCSNSLLATLIIVRARALVVHSDTVASAYAYLAAATKTVHAWISAQVNVNFYIYVFMHFGSYKFGLEQMVFQFCVIWNATFSLQNRNQNLQRLWWVSAVAHSIITLDILLYLGTLKSDVLSPA